MRKIELAIVLSTVAIATAWWNKSTPPPKVEIAQKLMTRSGRFEILAGPYGLAGLQIGCEDKTVVATLGEPNSKADEDKETHTWTYTSDGSKLHLVFLENRLIGIDGSGRYSFSNHGAQDSTLFLMSQDKVRQLLGEPNQFNLDETPWVYQTKPGELTIRFQNKTVAEVEITGEVKPTPISP